MVLCQPLVNMSMSLKKMDCHFCATKPDGILGITPQFFFFKMLSWTFQCLFGYVEDCNTKNLKQAMIPLHG